MEQDNFLLEMGNKIRAARRAKNISLDTMTAITGFDRSNLSMVERGLKNCRLLSLKAIADVLEMDVKDFL
jgi:transcriptional regulator with XRE-family HTH domain